MADVEPYSVPSWNVPMHGTLMVIGSAPCLFRDYERARARRPLHHVMSINEAAGAIAGEHVLAGHIEKAAMFIAYREQLFPHAPAPCVHASFHLDRQRLPSIPTCVTHVWRGVSSGATSAWKAVKIGRAMGYDEVVLCGCPLEASGYFNQEDTARFKHGCARIGYGEGRMYENYRVSFAKRAKEARSMGWTVYSMSGYSRELLGEIPP